jgi:hypothetical protein
MLITGEPHCGQDRLARIVHAISLFRERPLVAFDHGPGEQAMQGDPALHQAATVLLNLDDNRDRLDPVFTPRLFFPRYQTRVIALARSVGVASAALGKHHVEEMTRVRLAPLSSRSAVIHRLLDGMFQERASSLRVCAMTPHNQDALRRHRWAGNFTSLREAVDRLVAVAQQASLRKASLVLGIPPATFHNWYANIVGLELRCLPVRTRLEASHDPAGFSRALGLARGDRRLLERTSLRGHAQAERRRPGTAVRVLEGTSARAAPLHPFLNVLAAYARHTTEINALSLIHTIHAHPTFAEAVRIATEDALRRPWCPHLGHRHSPTFHDTAPPGPRDAKRGPRPRR